MSDAISSQNALDPDRPWITDEEDLPSRMNWFDTLTNPTGKSSKLHFTRAWTFLFMTQLIVWIVFGFIISLVGIAGVDTSELSGSHKYLIAVMFAVTTLMSFVIHSRRLNHAGKTSIWALLVILPLILGAFAFMGSVSGAAAKYEELYEARAEFLADPAAWREARLEDRRIAQAEAEKAREAAEQNRQQLGERGQRGQRGQGGPGGPRGGRGGQRGGASGGFDNGPSPENPLPTKSEFIVRPNLGSFYMPIFGLSIFIMIWSLTWVARTKDKRRLAPDNGQSSGPFG